MNEHAVYWLELVDYDFETAKAMFQTERYLYVGFMCHQTIEKALKAVISQACAEGEIPPRIHDLSRLAVRANLMGTMSEEHQNAIEELNPLNIEARYPEDKEQLSQILTQEKCQELLTETEDLVCWIKEQL
ncbi:MAG: HEPN domain-containing protein [Peptococcaceae bacterium]|nr:HEPN domain-containing protein [Peptococcaceae bacterium]